MGKRGHLLEIRRKVLNLVQSSRPVAEVAKALGIRDQTTYTLSRQDWVFVAMGLLAVGPHRVAELDYARANHRRALNRAALDTKP